MGKKRAASGESSAPDMSGLLSRLEKWLARHRRHFLKGLLPGASPADLESLQKAVGVPVPADLKALLAWHNGQSDDCPSRFEQDWILLSSDRIADVKRDLDGDTAARDGGWKPDWVPFLDDDSGDYGCVDSSKPEGPVREFWQGRKRHPVVAPSLAAWLAGVVGAMERGEYHEDPERGSFLRD
jgi:cell wall assembly regulator SMI1